MKLRNFFAFLSAAIFAASAVRAEPGAWKSADESTRSAIAGKIFQGNYPEPVPPLEGGGVGVMSFAPSEATEITPEIQALARGLKKDAWSILQYCSDRIRHEAYWGSKKGATLTLLEGSGNSFDTAALMVALLREAGYQDVKFRYGMRIFSEQELEDWLGLISPLSDDGAPYPDSTDAEIRQKFGLPSDYPLSDEVLFTLHKIDFLILRGYPYLAPSGGDFKVPHVWVTFKDAQGTVREVDPSFKFLERYSFEIPSPSTFGYNRTTFLNNLGGSLTDSGRQISGIGVTTANGLNDQLSSFTNQFRTWLRTNHQGSSTDDFINRGYPYPIRGPITAHYLSAGSDYDAASTAIPVTSWNEIPSLWETKIKFTFGQAYNGSTKTFGVFYDEVEIPTNALGGRKLSLSYSGNSVNFRIDEESLAAFTATPTTIQMKVAVNHPGGEIDESGAFVDLGWMDDEEVKTYVRDGNAAYAIIYGFDPSAEHLRKSQERLDKYRKSGLGDGDWQVKTESLNVMGLNWMAQTRLVDNIVCTRTLVLPLSNHSFGRVSQEGAFYIDVGLKSSAFLSYSARKSTKLLKFHVNNYFGSALEHGILEQTQGPSLDALSTVRVIQLANAQSVPLHLANSSNWTSVRNLLDDAGNGWPVTALDKIASQITGAVNTDNAATVLVPRRGNIGMMATPATDKWRGYGYALNSNLNSGYYISGGYADGSYSGGYSNSNSASVSSNSITRYGSSEPGYYSMQAFLNGTSSDHTTIPRWAVIDPVDIASGAFLFENTDLQVGGPSPRGLSFHRSYNSNRADDSSTGLGNGWTHNLHVRATRRSAARAAMGDSALAQMAATYVAVSVALDVYANKANAKDWAVTALTAGWGVDQMRDNGISINIGGPTLEFVRMPDGTFVPPAGITMSLSSGPGGTLLLAERHGNTHNFDIEGKLTSTVDQHGATATFTYGTITVSGSPRTVLDKVSDHYGRLLDLDWVDGRINSVTETAGTLSREVAFSYTGNNLTTATDPEGKNFYYGYDQDRISSLVDGLGRTIVANFYDEQGRVFEQHLNGDPEKSFKIFISGYRNIERSPQGGETTYVYDRYGRCESVFDALGNESYSYFDGQNRIVEFAEPGNSAPSSYRPTRYTYNADHDLTMVLLPKRNASDPNSLYSATREYDSQKRLWKDSDYKGKKIIYTYTSKHQLETITDRKNQLVQTNTYYPDGSLATVKNGTNKITWYLNYDGFGHPRMIEYPSIVVDGVTVVPIETFLFDERGNLLEHTDRNGNKTTITYNERRQAEIVTLAAVDGASHTTEIQYDDAGNAYRRKDGNGNWLETEISQTGKLLSTKFPSTDAGTAVIRHKYDSADRREWSKDPYGRQTTFSYDLAGRLTSTTDALGRTAVDIFDENGRLEESVDFRNKSTFFRYTWRGELDQTRNALTHESTTLFDANGTKDTYTNNRGKVFDFAYDENGRPQSLKTPLLKERTKGWTVNGQIEYIREPSSDKTEFTYDGLGLVKQTVHMQGATVVATLIHARDRQGNIKSLKEGAKQVSYTYDERNRMRSFTDVRTKTIGYRYDGNGNLKELIYPDGKGSVFYTWNSLNRLESVTDWNGRVTRYFYDIAGRLIRGERANETERRYSYDAVSQLTGVSEISSSGQPLFFSYNRYDGGGRRDRETLFPSRHAVAASPFNAVYDDDDRLSNFNGTAVVHDSDGNMTTGPLGGVASSPFGYDTRNRLAAAGGLTYSYDPAGNRSSVVSGSSETKWTIDPNGPLSRALVREAPGGAKTWYIYGLGLLYEISESNQTITYHYDSRGSTVAMTADDGTTVVDRIEYDPYGRETWRQGSFDTPFRYHGSSGVQTDSNGLCYMRARYYHPQIRRFINADPIGFEGGTNWYQYAAGNPIAFADPNGLEPARVTINGTEMTDCIRYNPTLRGSPATWEDASPVVHGLLDGIGLLPAAGEVADGINGIIYFIEGNKVDGTLSFAAMVPVAGWGATGAKALKYADEAVEGVKYIDNAAKGGGRLGNPSTRAHIDDVATEMEKRGWEVTGGGGRLPEEYLPGPGGARNGSSFPDITATKDGRTLRVNTVDTRADGVTPTTREATNAARIRSQTPGDHLLLVPKPKKP
ncbi:RHS repeat-associated core domain-containing protein [Luteolibacter luteus]|uniref:RHS repeat-associated core domain-containing protein n=1 Tax=Luteolibacter luteus TaxID=2728835 RepID=A0A858REK7_9BACT|nr:RHS repeat-associated core domain-containing protein [Luteolibacter luteus]QJE95267.1 RHS repeat-associated core domain-containing protein [Luteolibacter luteus]